MKNDNRQIKTATNHRAILSCSSSSSSSSSVPSPGEIERQRKEIVERQKRLGKWFTALIIFNFAFFLFNLRAFGFGAQVSGTTYDASGNPSSTNIQISSISTPLIVGTNIIRSLTTNVISDASGNWTVSLVVGDYRGIIGGNVRDSFIFTVATNVGNLRIENLITNKLTYAGTGALTGPAGPIGPQGPPAFPLTANSNAGGYAITNGFFAGDGSGLTNLNGAALTAGNLIPSGATYVATNSGDFAGKWVYPISMTKGDYLFRLYGANDDGLWDEPGPVLLNVDDNQIPFVFGVITIDTPGIYYLVDVAAADPVGVAIDPVTTNQAYSTSTNLNVYHETVVYLDLVDPLGTNNGGSGDNNFARAVAAVTPGQFVAGNPNASLLPVPTWAISDYFNNDLSTGGAGLAVNTGAWLTNALNIYSAASNNMLSAYGSNVLIIALDAGWSTNRGPDGNYQLNGSFTNGSGVRYSLTNICDLIKSKGFLPEIYVATDASGELAGYPTTVGAVQFSNDWRYFHTCGVAAVKIDQSSSSITDEAIAQNAGAAARYYPLIMTRTVNPQNWYYGNGNYFAQQPMLNATPYVVPAYIWQTFNYLEAGGIYTDVGTVPGLLADITNLFYPYATGPGHFGVSCALVGQYATNVISYALAMTAETVSPQPALGTNVTAAMLIYMTNANFIKIWRDPLCAPGVLVTNIGLVQVWQRPLSGNASAVVLFNTDVTSHTPSTNVTLNLSQLGLTSADFYDVWGKSDLGVSTSTFAATVQATNCLFCLVTPCITLANGLTLPLDASYSGPVCSNGLAQIWNSNGWLYARTSRVGATNFHDTVIASPP